MSKRTELALRAVRHLATVRGRLSGRELADATGTSVAFLSQVMAPLIAAGWVGSRTGPAGGYELMPAARSITLLDVVELEEGPMIDGQCVLGDGPCDPRNPCAMHGRWLIAREHLLAALADVHVINEAKARPGVA